MKRAVLSLFIIMLILVNAGCTRENRTLDKAFKRETHITDKAKNLKVDAEVHIPKSMLHY